MNKIKVIKEIIEDLLEIRQKRYGELIDALTEQEWALDALNDGHKKTNINIFDDDKKKDGKDIWDDFVADFDLPLIKLNNLLSKQEQNEEVLQIEKDMVRLHNKKNLSVKDFDEKYNMSKSSQQQYRSRMQNPLPYHQKVAGGKIIYVAEEVERWFENQYK